MKVNNEQSKLFVSAGSEIDFSRYPHQLSSSAKLEEIEKNLKVKFFPINDLKSASIFCLDYIKEHNLGGSNWIGGKVVDENMNFVAHISYNGRVWDSEIWKEAKEIVI